MRKPLVVRHFGRAGNRLFQYFFSSELARRAGTHTVTDVDIPDLDLKTEQWTGQRERFFRIEGRHQFDLPAIVAALRDGEYAGASFRGFAMRQEYYDRDFCRHLLGPLPTGRYGFGPEFLVINIRAGEIVQGPTPQMSAQGYGLPYGIGHMYPGVHPDYRPLPLTYYEELLKATRLKPAFVGEMSSHEVYGSALRRRFPHAIFTARQTAREDFLTLLGSSNIALAVSSFSWMAAWLSDARTIHIPVAGLFDPAQRPDVNLLPPPSESRYVPHALPRIRWQGSAEQMAQLLA